MIHIDNDAMGSSVRLRHRESTFVSECHYGSDSIEMTPGRLSRGRSLTLVVGCDRRCDRCDEDEGGLLDGSAIDAIGL